MGNHTCLGPQCLPMVPPPGWRSRARPPITLSPGARGRAQAEPRSWLQSGWLSLSAKNLVQNCCFLDKKVINAT